MKKFLSLSVLIAILWGCCNVEDTPKTDEKPANYKVMFDANGGKGIMPEQVFISGTIQELNTNSFENGDYVFTYWNTEADGTGATYVSGNYYSLTSDITLYAQWEIDNPENKDSVKTYTVTFDANGGSGIMPEQVFISGTTQVLNTNVFENGDYVFTYWNTEADGTGATYVSGNYYSLTSDITLYAQWKLNENKEETPDNPDNMVEMYTVTFNANDGTEKKSTQIFISGKKQSLNTNCFFYNGYTFIGWNTETDGNGTAYTDSQSISITSDLVLYAQWKLNENEEETPDNPDNPIEMYTVTFNANDGTEKKSTQIFISGKKQSLNTNCFFYSGYTFTGWNTKAEGNGTAYTDSQSISITSDLILYAQWIANADTVYTVEHYQQNIDNEEYTLVDVDTENKTGTTGEDTSATAKDYTGFTAKSVTQEKIAADGSTVVKIYYDRNTITLTFNLNDGEGKTEIAGKYGATVNVTVPTKNGYTFAGWDSELPATFTEDTAYTAIWWNLTGFVYVQGATITGAITDSKIIGSGLITISNFYISDHEVTQAEYEKYCSYGETKPSSTYGDGDNYPAYYVNWYDALVYCNKRSMDEGLTPCYAIMKYTNPDDWGDVPTKDNSTWNSVTCDFTADGYRFPTELEWEYAARGGNGLTGTQYKYAGSNSIDNVAWHSENSEKRTHPVKTKKANGLGLYDMSGNVYEWCWDSYDSGRRCCRGGSLYSWDTSADRWTVSRRDYFNAYNWKSQYWYSRKRP